MKDKKPKILITNDDSITASGIWHLWHALIDIADLTIIAPSHEKSGVGLGITLHQPLSIDRYKWEDNTSAWKITGTPADCIRMGLSVVLAETPDMIVSGINHGSNSGRSVLYSGTIGGAIEGALQHIPSIAFSSENAEDVDYTKLEKYVAAIVSHMLEHPLSEGTLLNVNFPFNPDEIKGVRLARQGRSLWREDPTERQHPHGKQSYYWHGGRWADHPEPHDSDVALLKQGYVAAVPIHVNELTDHKFLSERREAFETLI